MAKKDPQSSQPTVAQPFEDAKGSDTESSSSRVALTEEKIRERAYHRYLERSGGDGLDFDDWLEAERELKGDQ